MKPALYVLCSSEASRKAWAARAEFHCDLETIPVYPVGSAMSRIHEIAAGSHDPFLVCRDSVWIGLGMGRQAARLIEELDARFPNWAACGNRGMRWDEQLLDFGRDVSDVALRTSVCAHTVISLDDNLLLINPQVLRRHGSKAPEIESLEAGALLSLECLASGSVMAVSPRLMTLRTPQEPGDRGLAGDQEFQRYYRSHFLNHYFPTPARGLLLTDIVDFDYVSELARETPQADVLDLHDRALAAAFRKPSLTICCRTQFERLETLERGVLSFSVCRENAALLSELHIRLITDRDPSAAEPVVGKLTAAHPAADLECWFHAVREKRLSRIDLLRDAIERAETDYIWFIDDDDYVNPAEFAALARTLVPDCPLLVVASAPRMKEGSRQAEVAGGFSARGIFEALRGDNQVPLCGMIFPVKLMRERLCGKLALGEYWEDYYLALLALTAPRVEVSVLEIPLAAFSSRGKENTTAELDRSVWHRSYATFLLEVLNNEEGNSPFLWQQANVSPWDWNES